MSHNNLNYHAKAFEKVDHYLHNALAFLAQPVVLLENCAECARDTIASLPEYLRETLAVFLGSL